MNPNILGQNMIFQVMRETFGEEWYSSVSGTQWIIWRRHINQQLFENDIIAPEAIQVISEADKRKWPQGTGFFSRVRDLCLVARQKREKIIQVDRGLEGIGSMLKSYPQGGLDPNR